MNRRKLKHAKYYTIEHYAGLQKKTAEDCAKKLGISLRTYKDKISGYSDFTAVQAHILSEFLGVSQDSLFLT